MSDKAVVIFSGGMDSFTVLNRAIRDGLDVYALTFDYGQRHVKEVNFAQNACEKLGVQHKIVDISAIGGIIAGSSLTANIDVPEGHYEAESMKQTVVPNRNMILLSLAVGYAVSLEASKVYYGAHSGDHAIYPDCRPEFVKKMQDVCAISNYDPIDIVVPYLESSKIDILKDGLKMRLDYGLTWTCYNGREHACGKCGACQERLEAFEKNNVTDPLTYEV
ncbi:7-cyano-7-deazaguanine synthase QueC [Psychrosphaera sp. B3R10]|uniref:7-cyano-7-deazaguanine synthase QueC n=1 Tax=unclassified Psychrosphaera TaxID=2641570 RepID=UPI001C09F448|nr:MULTISPECIES: 7-cyano-7-deazaguanine synthase QueC [unclassified Psychrosphaera]MBU2882400.1 7-cyano-7-deazaguanine synthase QueC [Psychrosphaera sp. I2R16]MBU2989081.1 7-cyano-7-deazaguanine synthase QueC [Psychrosphaera sp. B3R10]